MLHYLKEKKGNLRAHIYELDLKKQIIKKHKIKASFWGKLASLRLITALHHYLLWGSYNVFWGYRFYVYNITYIRKQNMNELIGNCKALKN